MSETERLRVMLDERGVEWWPMHDVETGYREDRDTEFSVYGCKHVAHEWGCRLQVDMLTPEQAIEATLGRGECRNKAIRPQTFWCDQCDCAAEEWADVGGTLINGFRYCPNCGKKVAE